MKTKEITTRKATILVVYLPEGATGLIVNDGNIIVAIKYLAAMDIKIPDGNWQHLGQLSDITEEQWKDVVEDSKCFVTDEIGYIDYLNDDQLCPLAKKSGLSLLKANGVLLENTITKPVKYKGDDFFKHQAKQMYDFAINRWQQAQEQVWKNVHIFIKK